MFPTFRQSMAWMHTWIGLVFGALLFLIFFAGTLSVFDKEIDRWMEPATRLPAPSAAFSLDALHPAIAVEIGKSPMWGIIPPSGRDPTLQLRYRAPEGNLPIVDLDPATGHKLPKLDTLGGSRFFLPLHYHLHIGWKQVGYWIVGFAACAMLLALISGVIIHARLIANLFTFRPRERPWRRTLDLHHLTGVAALPFYLMIALSGLLIPYSNLMPAGIAAAYDGNRPQFFAEVFETFRRPPANQPAEMAPLDPMLSEAARRWGGGTPALVQIYNAGDANAYVEVRRRGDQHITVDPDLIYFDGVSGQVLKYAPLRSAISVQRWLTGLHMAQFDRWLVRWLYFVFGLMGCVMIGAGMMIWVEGRRARHASEGRRGAGFVEGLAMASVTGPIAGALAYLIANRLIPANLEGRVKYEAGCFFAAWILVALHAAIRCGMGRSREGWREQTALAGALALAAPVLNWMTTGAHPVRALTAGQGGVAGVDLVLLTIAGACALILWKSAAPPHRSIRK